MVACMTNAKAVAIKETKNDVHLAASPSSGEDRKLEAAGGTRKKVSNCTVRGAV